MSDTINDNRDVTLDIIGREHQALMAAGQQAHFTLVAELILSVLTLAFCFGWVSISPQLSFGGLTISIPQQYLLLVLAAIITGLSWRVANLGLYGARTEDHRSTLRRARLY